MKVSEITIPVLKQYLRLDSNDDDILIDAYKSMAIQYCCSYMGCTEKDLDKYEDVSIVILGIVADCFDVHQFTTSTVTTNPIMQGVLDLHCSNFLGDVE